MSPYRQMESPVQPTGTARYPQFEDEIYGTLITIFAACCGIALLLFGVLR